MSVENLSQSQTAALTVIKRLVDLLGGPDGNNGAQLRDLASRITVAYRNYGCCSPETFADNDILKMFCANWYENLKLLIQCCREEIGDDQTRKIAILEKYVIELLEHQKEDAQRYYNMGDKCHMLCTCLHDILNGHTSSFKVWKQYANEVLKKVEGFK